MELANIESLLEAYFEGDTTLKQEELLRTYFKSDNVAAHLAPYISLFAGLEAARDEVSERELRLPEPSESNRRWWLGIAASFLIAIGVGGYFFSQPSYTQEEKEAIAAFQKSKESLLLLSKNFNKGAEELAYLGQFTESKNRILK